MGPDKVRSAVSAPLEPPNAAPKGASDLSDSFSSACYGLG
jgi:hypothetical protein